MPSSGLFLFKSISFRHLETLPGALTEALPGEPPEIADDNFICFITYIIEHIDFVVLSRYTLHFSQVLNIYMIFQKHFMKCAEIQQIN